MPSYSNIPWRQYLKDCGGEAQEANTARTEKAFREKYHGKVFIWSGTIESIQEASDGFEIGIVMEPRDQYRSGPDLTLSAGKDFEAVLLALNKGDSIGFEVEVVMQGGYWLNHRGRLVGVATQLEGPAT